MNGELKNVMVLSRALDELETPLQALSERGIKVEGIDGAYRFVARFAAEPVDAVILDLVGLRRQDIEVLQVLREIKPDVGIVALTDPDQRDLSASALCAGADLYLLRPVEAPELVVALDRAHRQRPVVAIAAPSPALETEEKRDDAIYNLALGVAHEVNNPLTTISGWLQVLTSDHANDEKLSGVFQSMNEEADRIADIVRQLLLYAQQAPPKGEAVDIGAVLTELSNLYEPLCKAKGVVLDVKIPPGLPAIKGDETQLRQACEAIFAEAQAVLNASNRMDITCESEEGGVSIVFHDNGPTIPYKHLAELFEPFQHGRQRNGNALGLCLSHGIIRSHGGSIVAESSESTGTRFAIWLPSMS